MIKKGLLAALALTCLMTQALSAQTNPHIEPLPLEIDPSLLEDDSNTLTSGLSFPDSLPHIKTNRDAEIDALMATYLADAELQTERPEREPEPVEYTPSSNNSSNAFTRAIAAFFQAIGPLIGYLLIALVAGVVLYALYMMFGESLTLRRRDKVKKNEPEISIASNLRPQQDAAKALLADADKLAAEGRFAEAVHLLLFRSINDIQEKQQGGVPRSLTSREIGRLESLPIKVRAALSPIIGVVERSFFGGRPVDKQGWQDARTSYEDFAFGEAWA